MRGEERGWSGASASNSRPAVRGHTEVRKAQQAGLIQAARLGRWPSLTETVSQSCALTGGQGRGRAPASIPSGHGCGPAAGGRLAPMET